MASQHGGLLRHVWMSAEAVSLAWDSIVARDEKREAPSKRSPRQVVAQRGAGGLRIMEEDEGLLGRRSRLNEIIDMYKLYCIAMKDSPCP